MRDLTGGSGQDHGHPTGAVARDVHVEVGPAAEDLGADARVGGHVLARGVRGVELEVRGLPDVEDRREDVEDLLETLPEGVGQGSVLNRLLGPAGGDQGERGAGVGGAVISPSKSRSAVTGSSI